MKSWTLEDWGLDAGYAEGPVVMHDGSVISVAIDRGEILRWRDGTPSVLATTGGGPTGLTVDASGKIYVAQRGARDTSVGGGVQVVDHGRVSWLSHEPNASNDLAFGPDGLLYVTDPTLSPARDEGRVWRVDPSTGSADLMLAVDWFPNGIGFSSDDSLIWIADTRHSRIVTYRVDSDGFTDERTWATTGAARPDGFAFDAEDNLLVCCVGLGEVDSELLVFAKDSKLIAKADIPNATRFLTNVAIDQSGRTWVTDADREVLLLGEWGIPGRALHPVR